MEQDPTDDERDAANFREAWQLVQHDSANQARHGGKQRKQECERRPRQPRHCKLVAYVRDHGGADTYTDARRIEAAGDTAYAAD